MNNPVSGSHILAVGCTDVGQRSHNEDALKIASDIDLMIVADGVGGHQAGEVASGITCDVITREIAAGVSLETAIRTSNREVMQAVKEERGNQGMASTVVAAHFDGPDYHIAWVGDSRAYLWDGQLKLLTQDHSFVQSLLSSGQITLEQAREHPRKNVIIQAIGLQGDDKLQVDENQGALRKGQILLLCSDGFSDVVDSAGMSDILANGSALQETCDALVDAAVQAGGKDNISVVLIAGLLESDVTEILRPTIYWTFDPASGEYSGLPKIESYAPPPTRKVLPKGASQTALGTTQLVAVDKIQELLKEAPLQPQLQLQRRRRGLLLWVLVSSVVVAGLIYGLGIQGAG
jgi:serine/threonine protein phosphatase PrpC